MSHNLIPIPNYANWPYSPIEELSDLVSRGTAPLYVDGGGVRAIGQRCVTMRGFDPSMARFHDDRQMRNVLVPVPGDVLLNSTGTGTIGRVCTFLDADRFVVDGHVTVIRPKRRMVDGGWIAALLQSAWGQRFLEAWCYVGSTNQVELANSRLAQTWLPLPTFPEQQRITDILDSVNELICSTQNLIAKLEHVKEGLLLNLLTCGLDQNFGVRDPMQSPDLFRKTPLGKLPAEWSLKCLGEISESITSGSREWGSRYSDSGAIFLRIGNLARKHINLRLDEIVYVSPPDGSEVKRTAVRGGDVLISITADLGIIGAAPDDLGEAYVNQHVAMVRPRGSRTFGRWIAHYLSGHKSQQLFRVLNDSGAKAGLNLASISGLRVPVPNRSDELARIVTLLDGSDLNIANAKREVRKLQQAKLGLMADLLTGRVRVKVT